MSENTSLQISNQPLESLLPSTEQQPAEYRLLTGHLRENGTWKSDMELRTEYVQLTDELIRQMTEGVKVTDPITNEEVVSRPDYVIWLDKSARPVSWLTKELWPTLAADAEGNIPSMPTFAYVNIDREQWVNVVDPGGAGITDINLVDDSVVRSLRSIFVEPKYKRAGLQTDIDNAPSSLDGKTILIVDEVKASGRTAEIAGKFFRKAFPSARIATEHWMRGQAMRGQAMGNADLPVWYKENEALGRGVGNRDERKSKLSPSLTQQLGSWFLSTSFSRQGINDVAAEQLRAELKHLSQDVKDGSVLFVPSKYRDDEGWEERATRINKLSVEEFQLAKQALLAPKQKSLSRHPKV